MPSTSVSKTIIQTVLQKDHVAQWLIDRIGGGRLYLLQVKGFMHVRKL